MIDDLTGLHNVGYVQSTLDHEMRRSVRYRRSVSALVLELDGGESILESLSPEQVRSLLRDLAVVLVRSVREVEQVGFLGRQPPRFGLVLPDTPLPGAVAAADRIRRNVARHHFTVAGSDHARLSLSAGCASAIPGSDPGPDLLQLAAQVLERGRQEGPNRTHSQ